MPHLLILWEPLLLILLHGVGNGGEGHDGRLLRVPRVHQDLGNEGAAAILLLLLLLLLLQLTLPTVAAAQIQQFIGPRRRTQQACFYRPWPEVKGCDCSLSKTIREKKLHINSTNNSNYFTSYLFFLRIQLVPLISINTVINKYAIQQKRSLLGF